jgi:L-ascorbate metabolism protein UlaG (beta-lactamase superfamily)
LADVIATGIIATLRAEALTSAAGRRETHPNHGDEGARMRVEWYGQSAFNLSAGETTVVIDPFADMSGLASRGINFDYPPIVDVHAHVLLVTHEHGDHNNVEAIVGDPVVLRSTAGRLESPIGEIIAVASEHDEVAGTVRGPNTIFVFELDELRVAHFGDFGQSELRAEQAAAIGAVDLLFIPVGDGPTIGAAAAMAIVDRLSPRWVVPMHYRTPRIGFLESEEAFVELAGQVQRLTSSAFDTDELETGETPVVVVPAVP